MIRLRISEYPLFGNITIRWEIYSEEYDTLSSDDLTICVGAEADAAIETSGTTVFDENGVTIKYQGISYCDYFGEDCAVFYIENNSGSRINITSMDATVNEEKFSASLSPFRIYDGAVSLSYVGLDNEWGSGDTLSISFYVYDEDNDTGLAGDIFGEEKVDIVL